MNNIQRNKLGYKEIAKLSSEQTSQDGIVRKLTRSNYLSRNFKDWCFPEILKNEFKDSRAILLSQVGVLKDDDTLDELLAHIYEERGRSETE